ncbi:MAG: nucleotidyltransferase family protein, partial [Planctomycetaceae bacterium]|nr:nucleotidyltransferase family protein [Planctomycetaceae bacterium]
MSTTDPEHRLVCWLSDVEPAPATLSAAIEASRQPAFDWNRALQLAARNWVLPAVALNLARRELSPLPDEVRTSVRLAGIAARTNCTTIAAHLAPVFASWNAAGLRWALMKGAALIAAVYPPDARLLHDVDVLVAPEHYATARSALLAAGFAPATGVHTEEFMLAAKEQVVFSNAAVAGAASTQVDLHRETYGPAKPYRFDTGELLDRRRPASFCGVPVYALDSTDLLLHLSTQLLNDRLLVKLQRLADLG